MTAAPGTLPITAAADLAAASLQISPAVSRPVGNSCRASNLLERSGDFGRHLLGDVYPARTVELDPIRLVRLAPGARLLGGGEFLVVSEGAVVAEQVLPGADPARISVVAGLGLPTVDVGEECVLVARYGIATWGHWLGELLPRIVVVEAAFPGRFRFVLPRGVIVEPTSLWPRVRESLAFYGIPLDRIVQVDDSATYSFDGLHVVTGLWSQHFPHPHASECMRRPVPAAGESNRRFFLRRSDDALRGLVNAAAVEGAFMDADYAPVTVGALPFANQVALFSSASRLGSVLGSSLTGLMYSPVGVDVVSLAPAQFGDRFFYALVQSRWGTMVDVRGDAREDVDPDVLPGNRPFAVDVAELRAFLGEGGPHA